MIAFNLIFMALSPETFFALSTAVGVAQIMDATLLKNRGDKSTFAATALVFSVIETGWAYICYQMFVTEYTEVPLWHPMSFLIYVITFFTIGIALIAKEKLNPSLLPSWIVTSGKIFGIYFATTSTLLWLVAT
jgi:hypothetical protein